MQVCKVKWVAVPVVLRNVPVEYPMITCFDGKWGVLPTFGRISLDSVIVLPFYDNQSENAQREEGVVTDG